MWPPFDSGPLTMSQDETWSRGERKHNLSVLSVSVSQASVATGDMWYLHGLSREEVRRRERWYRGRRQDTEEQKQSPPADGNGLLRTPGPL